MTDLEKQSSLRQLEAAGHEIADLRRMMDRLKAELTKALQAIVDLKTKP